MSNARPKDLPHQTENLVITCIDHRFHKATTRLLWEKYGVKIEKADRISYPGSSKAVVSGSLLPVIQTSHKLHKIKNVWLVDHTDCGGFGGLKAYESDEQKETEAHFDSLNHAAKAIRQILPQVIITSIVVNLEGEDIKPN